MLIAGYLLLCLLVALCGRTRRAGFVGSLFMCLLITPVLAFLILWMTGPKVPRVVYVRGPEV